MSICPRCGASFGCGLVDAAGAGRHCWCMQLPALPLDAERAADENSRCLCPPCLHGLLTQGARPETGS